MEPASPGNGNAAEDYEYRGLLAESWDVLRNNAAYWPDVPFFKEIIVASGQPALDVGCATGRLVIAYTADGLDVDGLDVSPDMLAIARRKARALGLSPTFHQQALETLSLPRRYRTILVPSSTLQIILDPDDAATAMRRLFDHLEPGGTIVASFMLIAPDNNPAARVEGDVITQDWKMVRERPRPEDGALIRRWSRTEFNRATHLESTWDRFEVIRDGQIVETDEFSRSPATREYTQPESETLFRNAGFVNVRLVHEFTQTPASPEDRLWCVIATKP